MHHFRMLGSHSHGILPPPNKCDQFDELFFPSSAPLVTIEKSSTAGSSRGNSRASPSLSIRSSISHLVAAGNLASPRRNSASQQQRLHLPHSNILSTNLVSSVSADDLFRMRNFSTSGKKIINKGDSIMSRSNLSINLIGSR